MAKRKRKSIQLATRGFGVKTITPKQLDAKLHQAIEYAEEEDWRGALSILVPLSQQYPQEQRVWEFLADASFDSGDMKLYQRACEHLFAMTSSGEYAYALGGVYLNNMHPLLALQTWRQALELDPNHKIAAEVRKTIKQLEPMEQEALETLGLPGPEGTEIAILHEQGQVYLENGDYVEARKAEEKILESHPEFISAHNNLSLVSWMEENVAEAIATAQAVLEMDPDNIHALSNIIHFLVISGDTDAARPYGDRLKASKADAWDVWTKKVEGLTYLTDDAGVVDIWRQAQVANVDQSPASAMFYHLSAVALARTGDDQKAITQWEKALAQNPGMTIARDNLKDIRKPISQRHGAWPFPWKQWLMPASAEKIRQMIEDNLRSKKLDKMIDNFEKFLNRHPDVAAILPRLLERGGPDGQDFLLNTIKQLKTPELLAIIKDFALSQNGTDQMRHQAARLAAEAKLIPKEKVSLWIDGKWREMMLMAYTFHNEPTRMHSEAVERLANPAFSLLQQGRKKEAVEAEALLRKALKLASDAPDLMNNLAMALQQQGRKEESEALIRDIVAGHPDYVFASASLARKYLIEGDLEAAETLLQPFFSRDRFHVMEFGSFVDAYIGLLVAKGQKDSARSWLDMWENVYPDDPQLDYWKPRLKLLSFRLPKLFR